MSLVTGNAADLAATLKYAKESCALMLHIGAVLGLCRLPRPKERLRDRRKRAEKKRRLRDKARKLQRSRKDIGFARLYLLAVKAFETHTGESFPTNVDKAFLERLAKNYRVNWDGRHMWLTEIPQLVRKPCSLYDPEKEKTSC